MALGQRTAKSGGRPSASGKDADRKSQTCLHLVRKPASANASPSELRGFTRIFSDRKVLNGPAMRPNRTPLAVENGVGKLSALEAPNGSKGKREWRTPDRKSVV